MALTAIRKVSRNADARGVVGHGVAAVHDVAASRQRHCRVGDFAFAVAGALPQRDVYRPVVAPRRGELAGAVQRVDDPHPVVLQPGQIVVGFLAEHRIAGPLGPQPPQDQCVRQAVARVAERPRITETDLVAHLQQQLPRVHGEIGGQRGIGQVCQIVRAVAHRFSIADDAHRRRTIADAHGRRACDTARKPATEWGDADSVPASPGCPAARAHACAAPRPRRG